MRRAFSDALLRLMKADDRVIFLTGDLGFGVFDKIIEEFPDRYVNVGVAEAQLVTCGAGLALEGWRPLVYSIASFMTGRAFEPIRVTIGYQGLPVVVVGAGGGYTYASSGVTHHAKEDVALMSLIPGMAVVVPGDPTEVDQLLPQMIAHDGPSYIRVGRFGEPTFASDTSIKLGQGRLVREGDRIALVTTGGSVVDALMAADALAGEGISPTVCHFHTIRPFDEETLLQATRNADTVIAIEDHGVLGGLGEKVQLCLARAGRQIDFRRLGPGDDLVLGNPTRDALMQRYSYDADSIAGFCRAIADGRS